MAWKIIAGFILGGALSSPGAARSVTPPSAPAAERSTPAAESHPVHRWSIALLTGFPSRGPAGSIEDAMQSSGFGDTGPSFSGQGIAHPFSDTGFGAVGFPAAIDVGYQLRGMWAARLLLGRTPIGSTFGYQALSHYATIDYAVTSLALMASATDDGVLHAALGPALQIVQTRNSRVAGEGAWESQAKLGFIARISLRIPRGSRFYLDAGVQYRRVGTVELGPYSIFGPGGDAVLAAMEIPFDHWLIEFGPGFRF